MGELMHCISDEQIFQDDQLRLQIRESLSRTRFPVLLQLEIEADRNTVTMRGFVNSFHERQIAISILVNIPLVTLIIDQIEVKDQTGMDCID